MELDAVRALRSGRVNKTRPGVVNGGSDGVVAFNMDKMDVDVSKVAKSAARLVLAGVVTVVIVVVSKVGRIVKQISEKRK